MEALKGKKTYIIAFLMVLVGAVNMATGDATGLALITENIEVLMGLGFAALRHGNG